MIKKIREPLYFILRIQLILLFFLPAMGKAPLAQANSGAGQVYKVAMYIIYAILSMSFVFLFVGLKKFKLDKYVWWIIAFYGVCGIGMIWGLIRGEAFTDLIRGVLPFCWYVYIPVIVQELDTKLDDILVLLAGIAFCFTVRLLAYYFIYRFGREYARVSYYFPKTTSFMYILGAIIFVYLFMADIGRKWISIVGAIVCYLAVIFAEAKSTLLATIFGVSCVVVFTELSCIIGKSDKKETKRKFKIRGLSVIILMLLMTIAFLTKTDLGKRWEILIDSVRENFRDNIDDNFSSNNDIDDNFSDNNIDKEKVDKNLAEKIGNIIESDQGSMGVRVIEYKTAYENWKASPILGQGIGYRWTAEGIDYGGAVLYMHCLTAYVLMDFGIVGIIYLVTVMGAFGVMIFKVMKMRQIQTEKKISFYVYVSAIGAAFIYANLTAIFRDIEFVLLCAVLISGVIVKYKCIRSLEKGLPEVNEELVK